jgi:hypothetical protein
MTENDLERRISNVESQFEVNAVVARYCSLIDHYGSGAASPADLRRTFASLFVDDAVLRNPNGQFEGIDAILTYFDRVLSDDVRLFSRHLAYNQVITVVDETSALHIGQWVAFGVGNDQSTLRFGAYHDELVKRDGVWRFRLKGNDVNLETTLERGWAAEKVKADLFPAT